MTEFVYFYSYKRQPLKNMLDMYFTVSLFVPIFVLFLNAYMYLITICNLGIKDNVIIPINQYIGTWYFSCEYTVKWGKCHMG